MKNIAHNPILPDSYFIPDVEAHVWKDGRVYLYGSMDIAGQATYCSDEYHVFSSDDLVNWVDHGVSFKLDWAKWYTGSHRALYAPDCAYKDGIYYLYYCVPDGRCGVAKSESPIGPFEDVGVIENVSGIDPAVFIDDDGQAYLYWGQFDAVRVAKLRSDMISIIPDTVKQPLTVAEHDFHEGSSVKKINGFYYFVYTDTHRHKSPAHSYGMATCLGYAVAEHPEGPFTYGGIIVDNIGCDPGTWNNHGSICQFKGEWYVFYHRSTHGFEFSRHVCIEHIAINNGHIDEVPITSSGVGNSIPASTSICAGWAALLSGNVRICGDGTAEAETYSLFLNQIHPNDTATYRYLSFAGENTLELEICADGDCSVLIRIDGEIAGIVQTNGTATLNYTVNGIHSVTFVFMGDFNCGCLKSFSFGKRDNIV